MEIKLLKIRKSIKKIINILMLDIIQNGEMIEKIPIEKKPMIFTWSRKKAIF